MMKPKAKLIPRRSAWVTVGTALPARVMVAIPDPGPTRTRAAVPKPPPNARCRIENIVVLPLFIPDWYSTLSNVFRKPYPRPEDLSTGNLSRGTRLGQGARRPGARLSASH